MMKVKKKLKQIASNVSAATDAPFDWIADRRQHGWHMDFTVKRILLIAIIGWIVGIGALVYANDQAQIHFTGVIATGDIAVYLNQAATQPAAAIDYGTLHANTHVSRTVYLKNEGTVPVTLTITAQGWTPTGIDAVVTVVYDYVPGTVIQPGAVLPVVFDVVCGPSQGYASFGVYYVFQSTQTT